MTAGSSTKQLDAGHGRLARVEQQPVDARGLGLEGPDRVRSWPGQVGAPGQLGDSIVDTDETVRWHYVIPSAGLMQEMHLRLENH